MTDPKAQEPVVEFAGVTLQFGGKMALRDISFVLERG